MLAPDIKPKNVNSLVGEERENHFVIKLSKISKLQRLVLPNHKAINSNN